jgi:hypothetical protein
MTARYVFGSLTRISDLADRSFEVKPIPHHGWATGDYAVVEVESRSNPYAIELPNGRMTELAEGDLVVGALGERYATLEATGTWREVGEDGRMEILGGGALLGRCTSRSLLLQPLSQVRYRGHVLLGGAKSRMADYAVGPGEGEFDTPTVLIIGTSMSAGKTTAARVIVRMLKSWGLSVLGAKLTGAGRYRDILAMRDAGADHIFDFVDAGLPSTICPAEEYRSALGALLSAMAAAPADVAVVEAGASPREPYNGESAVEAIGGAVRCTVLCASDPYAVLGVMSAFHARPDLVTGTASNTEAGIALVRELAGIEAINVLDKQALPTLAGILSQTLGLEPR